MSTLRRLIRLKRIPPLNHLVGLNLAWPLILVSALMAFPTLMAFTPPTALTTTGPDEDAPGPQIPRDQPQGAWALLQAPYVKYVGKRLPMPALARWYVGEQFGLASLNDQERWILALVQVKSDNWDQYQGMIDKMHRPLDEGGPVVIAVVQDSGKTVERVLRDLKSPPKFYLCGDKGGRTFDKLNNGVFPYFYVMGKDRVVEWQGSPRSADFHDKYTELSRRRVRPKKSDPEEESETEPQEPEERPPSLSEELVEKIETSLMAKKGSSRTRVELLRSMWEHDKRPKHELLGRLWDRVTQDLETDVAYVEKRIERKKYRDGRKRVERMRTDYAGFDSANVASKLWSRLGELEGKVWYERGRKAMESGDKKKARTDLSRIIKFYSGSTWAEEARKLLDTL